MRGTGASFWASIGLLLAALAVSSVVAVLGTWLLGRLLPAIPIYFGLVIGVLALIAVLAWVARRFVWIMPWYYLLPSLLFLVTFTVMPMGLTIFLAFTDYSGNRNTQLNPTTAAAITSAEGRAVVLESADLLRCEALYRGCDGVRVRLSAAGAFDTRGVGLEGDVLTVDRLPRQTAGFSRRTSSSPSSAFGRSFRSRRRTGVGSPWAGCRQGRSTSTGWR